MTSFWGIVPILFLWTFFFFKQVECQLGVTYTPFVTPWDTSPTTQSYSIEDVKVMLNIISEDNFPFVSTYTVGAPNGNIINNPEMFKKTKNQIIMILLQNITKQTKTRYRCSSVFHTALAAAEINKEQKSLALTVYQGLYRHSPPAQLISEIEVGFEIAQAANQIYPGTVPAIIFPSSAGFNGLFDMEENLKAVSKRARNLQLKFGVRISNCETTIGKPDNYHKNKELLTLFDFLICEFMPKNELFRRTRKHFLRS
ncbi:hypothetical protein Ocin01_15195 [Orchesella cincta]|uniref:Uncharacterized protein n=1 Tax=Orchesella cincta TaxID=48709 RepID=A0A1D2MF41_ORCCI|nr:hypothetical protein Ocin01_15195 [Orchesella cincta]